MANSGFDPALRRLALVVVLGGIMTILDTTIVNVAITTLGREFHASLSTIQWVLTRYTLALSMTIPITGWAVQRFGGKTMWITALVLFIAGSVLCGAAWSAASLIAFRVLQGVGGGLLMPVGQAMLARAAGPERMGRVMSVIAVPAMLAPVLGPVVGGLIVDHLAWRWMFYVNVPVCALALILAVRLLPQDRDRSPGSPLDTVGLALLSPGLAALVYGLSAAGNGASLTSTRLLGGTGIGVALIAAFAVHALRRPGTALLDLRLFRVPAFTASVSALFCYSAAMFGVLILVPLYLQLVRFQDPLDAGLMIAPWGLGAIVTMPVAGRVTDRTGPRGTAVTGIAVAVLGAAVYTQIGVATSITLLAAAAFVVGLGHGLILPSLMAATYTGLRPEAVPGATAASNILIRVATAFGAAVLAVVLQINIRAEVPAASGSVAEAAANRSPDTLPLLAGAFADSFWWAVGLATLALIPALLVPRRRAGAPAPVSTSSSPPSSTPSSAPPPTAPPAPEATAAPATPSAAGVPAGPTPPPSPPPSNAPASRAGQPPTGPTAGSPPADRARTPRAG